MNINDKIQITPENKIKHVINRCVKAANKAVIINIFVIY